MSNLSDANRQEILYRLARAYAEAVDLESRLWLSGDKKLANKAEIKTNALYEELAKLRADLWGEWAGDATKATADLTQASTKVEDSIDDIKGDIHNAQKVVKALGHLDQLIEIAAKFLI